MTCWLCTLLAIPHAPRSGDAVQELVFLRHLAGPDPEDRQRPAGRTYLARYIVFNGQLAASVLSLYTIGDGQWSE